jgi:hypothetical protein
MGGVHDREALVSAPWYDDRERIAAVASLQELHNLVAARMEAHARGETLLRWIVGARLYLDGCGYARRWHVVGREPTRAEAGPMSVLVADEQVADWVASGPVPLPSVDARCVECGDGWDLGNCHDARSYTDDGKHVVAHERCATVIAERAQSAQYRAILDRAGLSRYHAVSEPNGYTSSDPPWARLRTGRGDLVVGWRRRVIVVDWADVHARVADERKDALRAAALFPASTSTRGEAYIHAWGLDDAVHVLNTVARAAGLKPGRG